MSFNTALLHLKMRWSLTISEQVSPTGTFHLLHPLHDARCKVHPLGHWIASTAPRESLRSGDCAKIALGSQDRRASGSLRRANDENKKQVQSATFLKL